VSTHAHSHHGHVVELAEGNLPEPAPGGAPHHGECEVEAMKSLPKSLRRVLFPMASLAALLLAAGAGWKP
jgi:hypothetical protein